MSVNKKPAFVLSSAYLYRRSLNTNLRLAKEAGFENIELFLTRNILTLTLEEIKSAVDESGLNIVSIHLPIPFSYNENWPNLEASIPKALNWADVFDADWIVSHPLVVMADADDLLHKQIKARYFRILAVAMDMGAAEKLLIENMPNLGAKRPIRNLFTYPDEFFNTVKESGFGMTFDTTHWGSFSPDLVSAYRHFSPLIRNIHISDFLNGTEHIVPGEGELDLDTFLAELNTSDYSGQLTLELDFTTRGRNVGRNEDGILQDLIRCREWIEEAFW